MPYLQNPKTPIQLLTELAGDECRIVKGRGVIVATSDRREERHVSVRRISKAGVLRISDMVPFERASMTELDMLPIQIDNKNPRPRCFHGFEITFDPSESDIVIPWSYKWMRAVELGTESEIKCPVPLAMSSGRWCWTKAASKRQNTFGR